MSDPKLVGSYGTGPLTERGTAGKVDINEEGRKILTVSGKTVILRDARDLTKCDSYTEHNATVTVARYSPSGGWVASGDERGLVRCWSPDHPEKMLKKETPVLGGAIADLCWDGESKRILVGGNGGKSHHMKCFTFDTGSTLGDMSGHDKPVNSVALRPNKPMLAVTGGQDFKVNFFTGPPFKYKGLAAEHTNFVQAIKYAWDGSIFASVGSDSMIKIYNGESGEFKVDLPKEHAGSIYGCAFSPDSKQLLTVGGDKTCKLWDIEASKVVTSFSMGSTTNDMQTACSWAKSGPVGPVSISLGGGMSVLDIAAGKVATTVSTFTGEPTSVACDTKDKSVYVGDSNGGLTRFDEKGTGAPVGGKGFTQKVNKIMAKNGQVFACSWDDAVKQIENGEIKDTITLGAQPQNLHSNLDKPEHLAFVAKGKAGIIHNGNIVGSIDLSFECQGVGLKPSLDTLLVGEKNTKKPTLRVYSVDSSFKIAATDKVLEMGAPPVVIAYSHDGKYVAVGDSLNEVSLYDGNTLEPLVKGKWMNHTTSISGLAWSPNSQYLASSSVDSHLFIWNPVSYKKVKVTLAHKQGAFAVDWVDEKTLVSCGADRTVKFWEIPKMPE